MRVFAMMRHDDGLARRLQSPIGKAANEIRGRYALWFLCRRHAPPPIYRDITTIVGVAGLICPALMSATPHLCAGSDQPPLSACHCLDPRIGLSALPSVPTAYVVNARQAPRRRARHRTPPPP